LIDNLQEKLNFLYRNGKELGESGDTQQTINKILDEIIAITNSDQGYLFTISEQHELIPYVLRRNTRENIPLEQAMIPQRMLETILATGEPVFSQDTQTDKRFTSYMSVQAFHIQAFLCVPIVVFGNLMGILYLPQITTDHTFTWEDLELVESLAPGIGLLIDNSRLQQVALEKGRMQHEMQMARDVQESMIPKNVPQYTGWKGAFCWQPAYEVGGDFFDFVPVDDHTLAVVIADVSDKGMPAGLFMALSRTILRAVLKSHGSAAEIITRTNYLIHQDAQESMFVTMFFAILDQKTGVLTYVNGGHNPPMYYERKTGKMTPLTPTGMALGLEPYISYEQKQIHMQKGDFLFLYTDGVLDAVVRQKPFDEVELQDFIHRHRNADPDQIVAMLREYLCGERKEASSHDDLTVVVWKRTADEKDLK